jgi:predicted HicB family RNase H-like nuclease
MTELIKYKGYVAKPEDGVYSGIVLGIASVVHFEAGTPQEAEQAFRDSIDDYLDFCREQGKEPEKPMPGGFFVQADPDLHRRIAVAADAAGQSVNAWIVRHLAEDAEWELSGVA